MSVALLLIGTLGVGAFNALQDLALVTSTPLNVTLINASMRLWMLVVGAIGYAQRPARWQLFGALLSLAGVTTVLTRGAWARLASIEPVAGDALMLLAVLGWAVYSWLLARPPASMRAPLRPDWDWAVFLSLVAYRCWGLGVAEAGPTPAAFLLNLSPLFAAPMSATLLGDAPQGYHAAAFALIVGGIVVSTRRR
jgi:drug/metabolite transporter (DMT)-like permease